MLEIVVQFILCYNIKKGCDFSRSPFLYHLQTKLAAAATVVTTAAVVVIAAAATTAAK